MTLQPAKTYYVYRWHALGDAPISKLRAIGELWGIPGWREKSRTDLRWAIMRHQRNTSTVPHPLINVPIEL
jgi:hypothetical protein